VRKSEKEKDFMLVRVPQGVPLFTSQREIGRERERERGRERGEREGERKREWERGRERDVEYGYCF
jgi:hypothetical protein